MKPAAIRKRLSVAIEILGGATTMLLIALLTWLFLIVTPDQYSAECEILRSEMEAEK